MALIGLVGHARAGKDTLAGALEALGWRRRAVGDRIRQLLVALDPVLDGCARPISEMVAEVGWEEAKAVPAVRLALQELGTGVRRACGEDVWIRAVLAERAPGERTVVSDVRLPVEERAVRSAGGAIIRVVRPGCGPVRGADGTIHPVEAAIDAVRADLVVANVGTPADLARIAEVIHARWGSDP